MYIKQFEIFLKLLENKSFSTTAQTFGLSQPSISASLKSLEKFLGQKLFARTSRNVKPLPAALTLAPYALRIIETTGQAAWALNHQLIGNGKKLSLGVSSVPSIVFAPIALTAFHHLYPNIFLKLITGSSHQISLRVADGELDLGLVGAHPHNKELELTPFSRDQLILLASRGLSNTISRPPFTPGDLAGWPIILREEGSGTRAAFLAGLKNYTKSINLKAEIESFASIMTMVRTSLGATVISNLLPSVIDMKGLVSMELNLRLDRRFYIIKKKRQLQSPMVTAMIDIIKKQNFHKLPLAAKRP
ncbi:MAG: hypothetical protein AMR96_02195 [Candidatus Adiutrix intracellularis]|jgi:DNA-binding transcriptional LysR family regulator|nr:MAG: hypothetical protein AMR96_02195 [Candidatus Adiutrix intracellularis]MDR2827538.1 LysR family transcriptional regulator [Candidatus Adiutrix intracellularis]